MDTKTIHLQKIVDDLDLGIACGTISPGMVVSGGYVSDLLSDVMGEAKKGNVWVTLQGHPNIVAVAAMKDLSGIVLVNGRTPEDETLERANNEDLPIMTTEMRAFNLAGKLYGLLGVE